MSRPVETCLFVVATPIGNLADITLRALDTLKNVDVILSEAVTRTRQLLAHYGIKKRLESYRESNAHRMIPRIIKMLDEGTSVALVAEAGTPGISDPGRKLVDAALKAGYRVVPVPGPSSVIAALSVSGSSERRFFFEGFLPRARSRRVKRLRELATLTSQIVFFEAPHRLIECLKDMREVLGDRRCVIARELTKMHEEIIREDISGLIEHFTKVEPRGEFVIVCEGSTEHRRIQAKDVIDQARRLVEQGLKPREAAKAIASLYGLHSSDIYRELVSKVRR